MSFRPHISHSVFVETEHAETIPERTLTIKIRRPNTNQTEIDFGIACLTTANGHIDDSTIDLMEYMLTYHDIHIQASTRFIKITSNKVAEVISSLRNFSGTHIRVILYLSDFNPLASSRINVDVATIDLRTARRLPTPKEEEEICTICQDEFVGTEYVNSLWCWHICHHECLVEWIHNSLSCPVCRDTHF